MDLVIQSNDLSTEAVEAFKVAAVAGRVKRKINSARLVDIQDDAGTRQATAALTRLFQCDAAFVAPHLSLSQFRLLALDMDSTLINIESLDEVAALAGVDASLLQRVFDEKLRLNPGAEQLVRGCQAAGLKTLLVTGGFTFFTARMRERLRLDYTRSNELGIAEGRLTGAVTGPDGGVIVDADGKALAVRQVCSELGCATDKAIVIGDGANDLKMMQLAGLSVAYRAKPVVQAQAMQTLNHTPLSGVLEWFSD